ncbi:Sirtuin 5 and related class III sirtuins (SIR2 family) [Ceraceosorus bombacis]|uniref:Sirtuin 5 and related class III sirtuins (SIR2 family) n=1 Tax=Ceraceosorus bombacis TaxID=401625 RepID=A0A0P1BL11_9BASI|nr:Sirtuin 5 and related class III sirtuins (SIR2 family) [Ceraceosorus bombacis]
MSETSVPPVLGQADAERQERHAMQELNGGTVRPLQDLCGASSQPGPSAVDVLQDCDSEGLEMLEQAGEEESENEEDDAAYNSLLDEAERLYPNERQESIVEDLKENGMVHFVKTYLSEATTLHQLHLMIIGFGTMLPRSIRLSPSRAFVVGVLKAMASRILRNRERLQHLNTVEDVLSLLANARRVVVLSGAGISVSCGIPDFRSRDGIYANLLREGKYDLADPQDMFDKEFFMQDPSCFFSFANSIFPSNFVPSPTHRFIKLLEDRNVLLRNYSQNIDTLEQQAGITRVLNCHGSFARATCTNPACGYSVDGQMIRPDIFARRVPFCPKCHASQRQEPRAKKRKKKRQGKDWQSDDESDEEDKRLDARPAGWGVLKPCITFFGEKLSDDFDRCLFQDRESVDLILVMGTSLKVAPVSELIGHMPHRVPVVLINRTPIRHMAVDIQLLGDADLIVAYLCERLGWDLPLASASKAPLAQMERVDALVPQRMGMSHCWLFPGAEPGNILELLDGEEEEEKEKEEEKKKEEKEKGEQVSDTSQHQADRHSHAIEKTTNEKRAGANAASYE